ncbi:MAG: ATP-binding protein, partial [Lachnospiraceae bacterium]|nr:ATP-binding protein [Lachnospiraceae bacterium]
MDYQESKIWKRLENSCVNSGELGNIKNMCDRAVDLVRTIRDTFPDYTLHDEKHICNVINWMEQLLDDSGIEGLSDGECATLILAACYHDIGMCYTEGQRKKELKSHRFTEYLEKNPKAYLIVKKSREAGEEIPREIQIEYFRRIHPQRVDELLPEKWEINIVRRDTLAAVCKSHGEKIDDRKEELPYDSFLETDYIFCAILLRLADVLDFDVSRAPKVLYEFQKIDTAGNPSAQMEWKKHQASKGFRFTQEDRMLVYRAVCEDMQNEHAIMQFLDYVDKELEICSSNLKQYGHTRWQSIKIPQKAERYIERRGYQTGEYHLTLEADNVLNLLIGDDLYSVDATFIRELLQNALDAARARRAVDRRWNWEGNNQIVLSDWNDKEGNQWFRIDDSGIGMDEQTILNYFLRVGRSYYQSDEFKKLKCDNKKYYDFTPISKFGIGILSCFLKGDRIEISTRHYSSGKGIRFSMKGTEGYYNLAAEEKGHRRTAMPCADTEEIEYFRQNVGTSIAVRITESLSENIANSIKSYICYPDVPVCYKKGTEILAFPTEQELMEVVRETKEIRIPLPEKFLRELSIKIPDIVWEEMPYICLKCVPLDEISGSSFISGVNFTIDIAGKHNQERTIMFDGVTIHQDLVIRLAVTRSEIKVQMIYKVFHYYEDVTVELAEYEQYYRNRNDTVKWCADKFDHNEKLEDILKEISGEDQKAEIEKIYKDLKSFSEMINLDGVHAEVAIPFSINDGLNKVMEKFILPRCDSGKKYIDNQRVDKVYNGICIETAWHDTYGLEESWFEYTVLLLSGEFQPALGISRENVRWFPMKAAGYIELVGMKISNSGLACQYPSFYGNMEYSRFIELLDDAEFCSQTEDMLECRYNVSIKDMKDRMALSSGKEEIRMADFADVFDTYYSDQPRFYFLSIFKRALLQTEFDICWDFNSHGGVEYFITGLRENPITEAEKTLLPMTFVRSLNKNTAILTYADNMGRCALNADHPFSIWLMRHAESLAGKHKSLWKRISNNICR